VLTLFVVRDGHVEPGPLQPEAIARLIETRTPFWLDLEGATDGEFGLLETVFGFHPLAVEDCRIANELPKLDDYGGHLFTVLHEAGYDAASRSVTAMEHHFFLGEHYLVTVHDGPSPVIEEVRREAARDSMLLKRGTDFLLHGIVDRIIDRYLSLLDEVETIIDDLETRVVAQPDPAVLADVFREKRHLLHLIRSAHLQRDVINRLSREPFAPVSEKARLYFRDVFDHVVQVAAMAEFYRETLAGVRDAYLSAVSNRLNEVMKVLTIVATLLLPLTVITGIYGMNFEDMPELRWRYGYPATLVGMAAVMLGLAWYFKRKDWW
jgi:magnesium transporter